MGHAAGHISDHDGLPHVLSARQHALETLKFDGIDFSLLKRPEPLLAVLSPTTPRTWSDVALELFLIGNFAPRFGHSSLR